MTKKVPLIPFTCAYEDLGCGVTFEATAHKIIPLCPKCMVEHGRRYNREWARRHKNGEARPHQSNEDSESTRLAALSEEDTEIGPPWGAASFGDKYTHKMALAVRT